MGIFSNTAPAYWAAGLPVVPLRVKQKAPIPSGWQVFCASMPDPDTQSFWMKQFPDGNIGLPLGPCSGLVAIDLDTDEEKIRELIERIIPPTPWMRRGAKGAVYMFRSPAAAEHRTFRIKSVEGKSIVECLAKGTQIVLPPSIHPDTQMPYTATGNLWEMLADLPPLPRDIESMLRGALVDAGVSLSTRGSAKMVEWVSSGSRDSSMTSIAGLEARAVVRGERSLNEAFGEIETWINNFTEKVVGDSLDPVKGRQKIIEFIKRDLHEGKRSLPVGWDDGLQPEEKDKAAKEFGEDSEEWSVERLMAYLQEQFEIHDRVSTGRRRAVEEALLRMSKSTMTAIDKEAVMNFITSCSGKTVTMAALRRRLSELDKGDAEGTDHTEIAQLLIKDLSRFGEIRTHGDRFWRWAGSHWVELPESKMFETIAHEFGSMSAARKFNDHKGVVKVAFNIVPKGLRTSTQVGINFANGYLTSDLVLHKHDPAYGCTYVLPYLYQPEQKRAPQRFLSFLFSCWGDDPDYEQKIAALREAIAVTMFGQAYKFQRVFCLYGMPESGKSVLKDIVLGLMPEEAICCVRPHDWNDKFMPSGMNGKLINYCGELSETETIAGDRFKQIVDGDEIPAQFKNRDIFKLKPTCAHWFNSNHIPKTKDSSAGFTRRWLFLTFNKSVPKSERVIALAEDILSEERDLIAAWAIEVMPKLLAANNFTIPVSHERLMVEMAGANNSVRFFLTASGQVSLAKKDGGLIRTSESELHNVYWAFCRTVAHVAPVSLKTFRLRMSEMQNEFGFRLSIEKSPAGTEASYYTGVTLAGVRGQ